MQLQTRIVTLQPITGASPCAAANEDDLINRVIPARMVGYIELPLETVIKSSATPTADDTSSIWLELDALGAPLGFRAYYQGQWVRIGDAPEQIGAIRWIDTAIVTAATYVASNPAWQAYSPAITQTIGGKTFEALQYVGLP